MLRAAEFVQLKQYSVPTVRSELGKVTVCDAAAVAVAMPGHAAPPVGHAKLVVLTVQLPAVVLTV
jgi:hypothetical protein